LKRVALPGYSIGGMVARQIVLDRPTLVRYLILAGAAPEGSERIDIGTVPLSSEVWSDKSFSHLDIELRLFFAPTETSQGAGRTFWERKNWRKGDRDPVSSSEVAKTQTIAIKSWGESSGERYARLKEIEQPTLVFNGINDVMIPTINSHILAEHLPDARLILSRLRTRRAVPVSASILRRGKALPF
jgi:pimeloyl-ACP methyl ester carboxylesterase